MIVLYSVILAVLSLYSYSLVDLNLTLINHPFWNIFRKKIIYLGYFQRDFSTLIYLIIISALLGFYWYFVKNYKKYNLFSIVFVISITLLFSYPFLSHDFFNYIFDAKILTFYHQNPYLYKALDFPNDQWIRFMHWTHRTYPYGPVFLWITIIPSFFSFGKFILNFLFFKATFIIFYLLGVYYLNKMNKKWAVIFAVHPLIIMEGLVNSHNDLISLSLGIIGIYYLFYQKKSLRSKLFLLLSGGIKYITLPIIILNKKKKSFLNIFSFLGLIFVLLYLSFKSEIQPWYFLNIFIFLPFFEDFISKTNVFFLGLLLSYYPYIKLGGWGKISYVNMKHNIIWAFFLINLSFYLFKFIKDRYYTKTFFVKSITEFFKR